MEFIQQPDSSQRLGDYLKINLSKQWSHFRAAVAFVKQSGTRHLTEMIADFSKSSNVEIIAGIDHRGTSVEGLKDLLKAVKPDGRVIIFHNRLPYTFHPKIYLFKSSEAAEVLIGSGNLTEGGLFTNYEASINLKLDLKDQNQFAVLDSIEHTLDKWADTSSRLAHLLDDDFLDLLTSLELVPSEDLVNLDEEGVPESSKHPINDPLSNSRFQVAPDDYPFISLAVPRAPPAVKRATLRRPSPPKVSPRAAPKVSSFGTVGQKVTNFVMTLQKTDVGVGQTTEGTPRRSPEIFIPLSARDAAPDFWGWKISSKRTRKEVTNMIA